MKCKHDFTKKEKIDLKVSFSEWKEVFLPVTLPVIGRVCKKCGLIEFFVPKEKIHLVDD